jgi:hypothetical protein
VGLVALIGIVMGALMASGQGGRVRLGQVLVGHELVITQQMLPATPHDPWALAA